MNNLSNGQQSETFAQSQGQQNEDFARPQDSYDMTDEEFSAYTDGILNGTEPEEDEEDEKNKAAGEDDPEGEETEKPEAGAAQPYKSFETKEEYQSFMDKVIGERIKNTKARQEKYEELGRKAIGILGGEDEAEAIQKLIDDAARQQAELAGKTQEEYSNELRDRQDALMYRRQLAEQEARENALKAIQDKWIEEEAQLKAVIPDFDLTKAMQNPEFKGLVTSGMSIPAAYIKLTGSQKPVERQPFSEIGARTGQASSRGATDYSDLSDEEFIRRMDKIAGKS